MKKIPRTAKIGRRLEFFEFKYFQIGQAELIRYCQQGYYPLIFTNCPVKD